MRLLLLGLCGAASGSRYDPNISTSVEWESDLGLQQWHEGGGVGGTGAVRARDWLSVGELATPGPFPMLLVDSAAGGSAFAPVAGSTRPEVDGVLGISPFANSLAGVLRLGKEPVLKMALTLGLWDPGANRPANGSLQFQNYDDGHYEKPVWARLPRSCGRRSDGTGCSLRMRRLRVENEGDAKDGTELLRYPTGAAGAVDVAIHSGQPHVGLPSDNLGVLTEPPFTVLAKWWAESARAAGTRLKLRFQLEGLEEWLELPWEALFLPTDVQQPYAVSESGGCCAAASKPLFADDTPRSAIDCMRRCSELSDCKALRWEPADAQRAAKVAMEGLGSCRYCTAQCPEGCCGGPCTNACAGDASDASNAAKSFRTLIASDGAPLSSLPQGLLPEAFAETPSKQIVLGHPLFRALNVVFDRYRRRVGFAKAREQRRSGDNEFVSVPVRARSDGRKWAVDVAIGRPVQSQIRLEPDTSSTEVVVATGVYDGPDTVSMPGFSFWTIAIVMVCVCPTGIYAAIRLSGASKIPDASVEQPGDASVVPMEVEMQAVGPTDGWGSRPQNQGPKKAAKLAAMVHQMQLKAPACVAPRAVHED